MGKGEFLSTSILDKALSITAQGVYTYCLGGASYSGNDLPHNSHAYGSASIYWRNSASIAVVLFGASKNSPLSINLYNGSTWNGWETYVRNSDLTEKFNRYFTISIADQESFAKIDMPPKSVAIAIAGNGDQTYIAIAHHRSSSDGVKTKEIAQVVGFSTHVSGNSFVINTTYVSIVAFILITLN